MMRREIDELVALYELEPTLRDIYVEGDEDVCFLNTFFYDLKIKNIRAFPIDTIEVPSQTVYELGFKQSNNRTRVITLSLILKEKLASHESVLCIIDRDFDRLLMQSYENEILKYTDFTCMEMYVFNRHLIQRFLLGNYSSYPVNSGPLIRYLSKVLIALFFIRFANEILEYKLTPLEYTKFCEIEGNYSISFDIKEYNERLLNKNKKIQYKKDFNKLIEEQMRTKKVSDIRDYVHGHDFINLFCWYLKNTKSKPDKLYNPFTLWKALFLCLNPTDFVDYELFNEICTFANCQLAT